MATLPKVYLEHLRRDLARHHRRCRPQRFDHFLQRRRAANARLFVGRSLGPQHHADLRHARGVPTADVGDAQRREGHRRHDAQLETVLIDKHGNRIRRRSPARSSRTRTARKSARSASRRTSARFALASSWRRSGEVAVSLSHEINNPLEVITNQLELLAKCVAHKCTDEEFVVEGERLDAIQRSSRTSATRSEASSARRASRTTVPASTSPGRLMTDLTAKPNGAKDGAAHLDGVRVLVVDDDKGV